MELDFPKHLYSISFWKKPLQIYETDISSARE